MNVSGRSCETGEVITLNVEAGRIMAMQSGMSPDTIGGSDAWLAPGFFDLQVNGYGGFDFNLATWGRDNEVSNEPEPLLQKLAESGTALVCPTLITNSHEGIVTALGKLAQLWNASPNVAAAVPGFHLEGPYIASEDGPRGAHPLEYVRDPNWEEFQRFQEAAEGRIRLCTLAPERPGAIPFIEQLTRSGVVAALGHTAADPETIRDAVLAGAKLSTHLGNGAHSVLRRHPNYIWEQLACDELYASIITDGHHLPASVAKVMARAKGAERLALVSDAVALGGLPPGQYADGRYEVLPGGKIVTVGTPYLAGAGHLLDVCIANALRFTDLTLAQVVRCVTAIPARILGLEDRKGHLRVGYDADITLFRVRENDAQNDPLEIVATIRGGQVVYRQ
jgi:N-acetylglucosamine-6-phosphate deacetylase